MPVSMRVGLFPYLNVQPLVYGLSQESDIEVVCDLPSRIADRFRNGELDVAMVPSFEAAILDAPIVDSVCVSSDGPVETVALHHRVPLTRVKSIALDEASRTSAALAKILVARASGHVPKSSSFSPNRGEVPDHDAILVIGDPAFTFSRAGFDRMDLGLEWRREHSLPFVFAVMVVGPRALKSPISLRFGEAVRRGLEAAPAIAHSYNSGVDAGRAERYLRSVIRYDLGPREKEGLGLFYRLAQANGLLSEMKELRFHAI